MKSKVLSFVLLFAMLITILPVNTFADTNAISVVAKSNMADVKISGDTVNIDITKSVKDLAKMESILRNFVRQRKPIISIIRRLQLSSILE